MMSEEEFNFPCGLLPEESKMKNPSEVHKDSFNSSSIIGRGKQYESLVSNHIEKVLKKKNFKNKISVNIKSTDLNLITKMKEEINKCLEFWQNYYTKLQKINDKHYFLKFKEFGMDLSIRLEENEHLSSLDFLAENDSQNQSSFLLKGPCLVMIEITQNSNTTYEKFLQLEKDYFYLANKKKEGEEIYGIIITNNEYAEGLNFFNLAKMLFLENTEKFEDKPQVYYMLDKNELFYLHKKYVSLIDKINEQEEKIDELKHEKLQQDAKIFQQDAKILQQDAKIFELNQKFNELLTNESVVFEWFKK